MLQARVSQQQDNVSIFPCAKLCALAAAQSESGQHVRCLQGNSWKWPAATRKALNDTDGFPVGTMLRGHRTNCRQVSLFPRGQSRRGCRGQSYGHKWKHCSERFPQTSCPFQLQKTISSFVSMATMCSDGLH